jgi:cobalt-zinc-cadmium efflux system outer membrane protein
VTFNREAVAGVAEHMLMVTQPLPITGRRRLEVGAASARVDATANRADQEIRRLRADLRLAFTDLLAAQSRERELEQSRDRLRGLVQVLARREEEGESAGFDRLRAEREVIELDTARATAAAERSRAEAALASFFAAPVDQRVEAMPAPRPPVPLPPAAELMAQAERSRPDFLALQQDLAGASLAEEAAARRRVPEPELVAGTKSSNAAGGDVGSILGVHVTLPLFDRAAPERAAAQARAVQARAEREALRQTTRAQIAAWRAAAEERRSIAARYKAAVAGGADELERIAQVSYEAGERGILELLDAYRTASAAHLRQADLDAAARQAEIELEFVSGWEIP